jgi:hypothetical protein
MIIAGLFLALYTAYISFSKAGRAATGSMVFF